MTTWILLLLLISPQGDLLGIEQIPTPQLLTEETCWEMVEKIKSISGHDDTDFGCIPITISTPQGNIQIPDELTL